MTEQPNRSRNAASARARTRKTAAPAPAPATDSAPEAAEPAAQTKITIPAAHPMVAVLGTGDSILRVIEKHLPGVDFHARGNEITATGPRADVDLVDQLFAEMLLVLRTGAPLTEDAVERSIGILRAGGTGAKGERPAEVLTQNILSNRGRTIRPKTLNQKRYVDAIDKHTIVFGIGPAGTGKTYLAMAKAVQALQAKEVTRIILTRPAVEAGERLGFLPGTLYEKIDPYLRPLYDALHDMIDPESIPRLMAAGTIEVAPLAYMRGRTLNDAFIILDEAQNTSAEQMKMFLTRLGFGSKVVVTGDVTQVDLPGGTESGLRVVQHILDGVEDIHFARLTSTDVVRHRLVGEIVDAYGRYDAARQEREQPGGVAPMNRAQRRAAPRTRAVG
jgi:phosphate starvation-inducible PhoH-like protein